MERYLKLAGAAVLVIAALALAIAGQPGAQEKLKRQEPQLEQRIAQSGMRIDPGELYDLLKNNNILPLLLDVRGEADYNLFHIADARRTELAELAGPWLRSVPPATVIVCMSNDEQAALAAWKLLAAQGYANAYVLGGGINLWLEIYEHGRVDAPLPPAPAGDDTLRHSFRLALGDRQAAALPDPFSAPKRAFTPKIKAATAAKRPSGGCG